ncbi:hypothetical protein TNCT_586551 [Trichonephila clavata]|uniref:Uncharacterized protein n=1 Tax=Trichonephila clavata TaxID=2740835 RepID=A0A8X6LZX7_TRICU|nr:hypothetical protein TNCT_586551 [Trichonephila clavata]
MLRSLQATQGSVLSPLLFLQMISISTSLMTPKLPAKQTTLEFGTLAGKQISRKKATTPLKWNSEVDREFKIKDQCVEKTIVCVFTTDRKHR